MKLIAFVTMFFLPATFTSVSPSPTQPPGILVLGLILAKTFFSMDFFDWPKAPGNIATGYIWVYALVAAILTLITVGLFTWRLRGRKARKGGNDGQVAEV